MLVDVVARNAVGDPWKLNVVTSQSKIGGVSAMATARIRPASRASSSISSRNDIEPATAQTVRIRSSARPSGSEVLAATDFMLVGVFAERRPGTLVTR